MILISLTVLAGLLIIAGTVHSIAKQALYMRIGVTAAGDNRHAGEITAAVAALERVSARLAPPEGATGQLVTINTRKPDDQTIHGLLVAEYPDRLLLADAYYITAQGKRAIPGDRTRVYRDHIAFTQEHGAASVVEA